MAKILNQIRLADAVLKRITIEEFGTVFAINHGCDGFSIIDINTPLMPTDIKKYLEGDDELLIYAVPTNISKLGQYALATFKNIETIYLFKNDELMDLDLNTFGGLENLESVYVPEALYDSYVSTYPTLSSLFKKLVSTYEWTIPESAESLLTIEHFEGCVGLLSQAQKSAIGRIIVPSSFTSFEFGALDLVFKGQTFSALEYVKYESGEAFIGNAYGVSQVGSVLGVE